MIWATSITGMRKRVSDTAKWGDVACGPRIVDARVKAQMKELLNEIQSGEFARKWIAEHKAGRPEFTRLIEQDANHQIEIVGGKLRGMMPFLSAGKSNTSGASWKKGSTTKKTGKAVTSRR